MGITGGRNLGRVGVVTHRERHPGSFDIVHIRDAVGHSFATRLHNVFIIGKVNKAWVSLPRGKGVKLTIAEERDRNTRRARTLCRLKASVVTTASKRDTEVRPSPSSERRPRPRKRLSSDWSAPIANVRIK